MNNSNNASSMKFCFSIILAILFICISNVHSQNTSANIDRIWYEHNVISGNSNGMNIHVKFSVNNMLNKEGLVGVWFFDKYQNKLIGYKQGYRDPSGKLCVGEYFTPNYTNHTYNSFVIFMPYGEFNLTGYQELKFAINIFDHNNRNIAKSSYHGFTVNLNNSQSYSQQPQAPQRTAQQTNRRYIDAKLCHYPGIYYRFTRNGRVEYFSFQFYGNGSRVSGSEKYQYGTYYIEDGKTRDNVVITWDNGTIEKKTMTWNNGKAGMAGSHEDNCR